MIKDDGIIAAAFPFGYRRRHGMNYIFAPWQCASMGIWIRKKEYADQEEEISTLHKYVAQVVKQLPMYDSFKIPFAHELGGCVYPLLSYGFCAEPYYTMVINICDEKDYLPNVGKSRRNRIRHALRCGYYVEENKLPIESYWEFLVQSYESKNKKLYYGKNRFSQLISALQEHNACVIRSVCNDNHQLVGACIILEDTRRCYHQFIAEMSGKDTDAASLAVYGSINDALHKNKIFDFEGSMIKGVCEFNSSFNPEWEEYYIVSNYSRRYRLLKALRDGSLKLAR